MNTSLLERLKSYGIDQESGAIYVLLLQRGPQTALQLSRESGVSRTQVYRLLEELQKSQLVSADVETNRSTYQAMPYQNLEGKIASKEAEARDLRNTLEETYTMLATLAGSAAPKAKVLHYNGIEGLKQVNWNLTKAIGEYRVYEVSHLNEYLDNKFAERCREASIRKGTKSRDLTNRKRIEFKNLEPFDPNLSEYRHIDPSVLDIKFEMYIYNDVVTLLDYKTIDIFSVEIYHENLANMQKQIFDAMWTLSTPLAIS